ncbi:MAG TPA: hypothetical protein VGW39_14240 [Chthoniobacterales bacterium]|nr:hypothetical protein [Chthoniobacterales bacterium]
MPVTIDQITADVEPPATRSPSSAKEPGGTPPETEERRQSEILVRLARRAARLHAD